MTKRARQTIEYLAGAYGPSVARHVLPGLMWRLDTNGQQLLYLTFDDGPTPHLTPRLLDILDRQDVRATFFLLGKHVMLDPDAVRRIEDAGHPVALHGFDHLDAWKTHPSVVIDDLDRGLELISRLASGPVRHFRPPFGRFRKQTVGWARRNRLETVMWDVMPGDYMLNVTQAQVVDRVRRRVRNGSIIVLHDSWNASVMQYTAPALESMLPMLKDAGWRFDLL